MLAPRRPDHALVAASLATCLLVATACRPASTACQVSADCGEREVCLERQCHSACQTAAACRGNENCIYGACLTPGTSCAGDNDCFSFEACRAGRCRQLCDDDRRCPVDQVCHGGVCAAPPDAGDDDASPPDRAATDRSATDRTAIDRRAVDTATSDRESPDQARPDFLAADSATNFDHGVDATSCSGVVCDGTCFTGNCCANSECGGGNRRCVDHDCTCAAPSIVCAGDCRGPNACGGCAALPGWPGARCGDSNCGSYSCSGQEDLVCDGDHPRTMYYWDNDRDTWGAPATCDKCDRTDSPANCDAIEGGDCNDDYNTMHPFHTELCDGQDNDCDSDPSDNGVDECGPGNCCWSEPPLTYFCCS